MRYLINLASISIVFLLNLGNMSNAQYVHVYDNPQSSTELTGQTDFDPPDERGLSIAWQSDSENVSSWHVYVREDNYGYLFLGTVNADAHQLDWYEDAPKIHPRYKSGPEFGKKYQFKIIPIKPNRTADEILFQTQPVGINGEGGEEIDLSGISFPAIKPNQVYTNTHTYFNNKTVSIDGLKLPDDWEGIFIGWNFENDSHDVVDYHLHVRKFGEQEYHFLGSTGSDDINYYLWDTSNHFYTSKVYSNGPQIDKSYQFLVSQISNQNVIGIASLGFKFPIREVIRVPLFRRDEKVVPLELIKIKAGSYFMGDVAGRPEEKPSHYVRISKDFYMGKYEMTNAHVSRLHHKKIYDDKARYYISWYECNNYISKLNTFNYGYFRLPTEAEWEYACRAGTSSKYFWGNLSEAEKYAWEFTDNGRVYEVGLKLPNQWGLYDMIGNVAEWCCDYYAFYSSDLQIDPMGPSQGTDKVVRGQYIYPNKSKYATCSYRTYKYPEGKTTRIGFRLVREVEETPFAAPAPAPVGMKKF